MAQLLLFPDPRPLVERLGAEFFRRAPECAGVYLMRDGQGMVLYVGKAKNLRKRLASYRVANPDRMPRRHLRLLRAVDRIDLEACTDEPAALAREAELLRSLRPKFNRAGTWPGASRYFGWRLTPERMEMAVLEASEAEWHCHGPLVGGVYELRSALLRLFWCGLNPDSGLHSLPQGWFRGAPNEVGGIARNGHNTEVFEQATLALRELFNGRAVKLTQWVEANGAEKAHPTEVAVREKDLETATRFAARVARLRGMACEALGESGGRRSGLQDA